MPCDCQYYTCDLNVFLSLAMIAMCWVHLWVDPSCASVYCFPLLAAPALSCVADTITCIALVHGRVQRELW